MPERRYKIKQKYDSDAVQGPGSWVVIRNPIWEDIEAVTTKDSKMEDLTEIEMGKRLLERSVESWNWVDDSGAPLPDPTPEIIRQLPAQELIFLFGCIKVEGLDPKASPIG